MHLRLLPVFLAAALLVPASARASAPQVAALQVALARNGAYSGAIDGVAGPLTHAAIRRFQRRHGLVADGVAGARTHAALGKLGRPRFGTRPLRRGIVGWDVSVLQFLLARSGELAATPSGRFGLLTEAALVAYQRGHGLAADGIAGPLTTASLLGRVTPGYVVRSGDTLAAIAARYRTTLGAIARANALDPGSVLPVGRRLRIPALAVAASAAESLTPWTVTTALDHWSAVYGVDPHLVRALAWMESGYQTQVVSPAGASGVLQVLPQTRSYVEEVLLGKRVPRTTDGDVQIGVANLRHLLTEFGGNVSLSIAAWYQGDGAVRRYGVYPETRLFVADVLALRARL